MKSWTSSVLYDDLAGREPDPNSAPPSPDGQDLRPEPIVPRPSAAALEGTDPILQ